jgi:flagellar hook-length control protein FliK
MTALFEMMPSPVQAAPAVVPPTPVPQAGARAGERTTESFAAALDQTASQARAPGALPRLDRGLERSGPASLERRPPERLERREPDRDLRGPRRAEGSSAQMTTRERPNRFDRAEASGRDETSTSEAGEAGASPRGVAADEGARPANAENSPGQAAPADAAESGAEAQESAEEVSTQMPQDLAAVAMPMSPALIAATEAASGSTGAGEAVQAVVATARQKSVAGLADQNAGALLDETEAQDEGGAGGRQALKQALADGVTASGQSLAGVPVAGALASGAARTDVALQAQALQVQASQVQASQAQALQGHALAAKIAGEATGEPGDQATQDSATLPLPQPRGETPIFSLFEAQVAPSGAPAARLTDGLPVATASLGQVPGRGSEGVAWPAVPVEIGLKALSGEQSFQIKLHPEDLGRIEVKLDFAKDGTLSALLTVDKPETLSLLQRDVRSLERAFEQAGLKAGDAALQFSLASDGRQGGGRDDHRNGSDDRRSGGPDGPDIQRVNDARKADVTRSLSAYWRAGQGALDIVI